MRVFIALTFDDKTKEKITRYKDLVANNAIKGRFTRVDNYHLTLEFIGQVTRVELDELVEVLRQLPTYPQKLRVSHIGSFKRRDREIVWLGIDKSPMLKTLHKAVVKEIEAMQYLDHAIEFKKYTPHITLGRQVLMKSNLQDMMIQPFDIEVESLAIMESKRVGDQLVYEVIEEIKQGF